MTTRLCGTVIAVLALLVGADPCVSAEPDNLFRCGGVVERDTWNLWDGSAHAFMREEMLSVRLKRAGDSYALYDLETYLHNLAAMAARCQRPERLAELAALIDSAFDELTEIPQGDARSKAWVCRGGRVCNMANRLVGTEVALNSQQFLSLALRISAGLAVQPDWAPHRVHVDRGVRIAVEHLVRWMAGRDPLLLEERLRARPVDVRDGQSRLFFTDQDLWMIAIAAELSGLLASRPELRPAVEGNLVVGPVRQSVLGLLKLFHARITRVVLGSTASGGAIVGADLDRSFWRMHRDSRYAGYAEPEKPVECLAGNALNVRVPPERVPVVDSIGWDFSHARRLVHAMDALDRNRAALQKLFDLPNEVLPDPALTAQFAAQLAVAVWKGDRDWPLFANFWDGTDGWYRVAYDNGTKACVEGYAPSELSDSFATGGFAVWGHHQPVLGELGQRLYRLSLGGQPAATSFIDRYYSQLGTRASPNNRMLTQLMFWPSIVQRSKKS